MGLIDWLILAVGLAGMAGLGLWTARGVRRLDDFLLAGRRYRGPALALFHSGNPMQKLSSITARMFQVGLAGLWYEFIYLAALPFWWIIGPVVRRLRIATTADLFERRFHPATVWLYVAFAVITCILSTTVWLVGVRKLIELMAGSDLAWQPMLSVIMGVSLLAVWAGGFRAVVVTGITRGLLMLLLTAAGVWLVFGQGMGPAAIHAGNEALAAQRPELLSLRLTEEVFVALARTPMTPLFVAMMVATMAAGSIVGPMAASSYGCARSERATALGVVSGGLIKRACVVAWAFLGLAWVAQYATPDVLAADPTGPGATLFADGLFAQASHDLTATVGNGAAGLLWVALAWAAVEGGRGALILVLPRRSADFTREGQALHRAGHPLHEEGLRLHLAAVAVRRGDQFLIFGNGEGGEEAREH